MHVISRDAPCYYLTSVTRHRLPIFQTDRVKLITCTALKRADAAGELQAPKSCASGIGNYLVPIPMVECAMLGW